MKTLARPASLPMTDARSTDVSTKPAHRRGRIVSALLAVVGILGLTTVTAAPAHAASGTTTVTICVTGPSSGVVAHAAVSSFWWNGTGWQGEQGVQTTRGCGTLTLRHNGYYSFKATSYVFTMCVGEWFYGWTSGTYVKQQLPAASTIRLSLPYTGFIPTPC